MIIKILGRGCTNCKKLEANARQAAQEMGLTITVEKILDMKDIASFGVMSTPAMVIDDTVKLSGRVASVREIKQLLQGLEPIK